MIRAVGPIFEQSCVPERLFRYNFASGKLETFVDVAAIHRVNVTVDPDRITPVVPGTPDGVGN